MSAARVRLVRPEEGHAAAFLAAVARSRELHKNLVTPVGTNEAFRELVERCRRPSNSSFLVATAAGEDLVGAINIDNIVRGYFQSAYLGYYAFVPHAGKGLMRDGLIQAIGHAFNELNLHRLEANIQPQNTRSIRLVEGLGFRLEGYSPKYLKVSGRWRDHERWAVLASEWRPAKLRVAATGASVRS